MKNYTIGITGASGVIYGLRLIKALLETECIVNIIVSDSGKIVIEDEIGIQFNNDRSIFKKNFYHWFNSEKLRYFEIDDMRAPIASGSFKTDCMVVIPCTMATCASIAGGLSKNLIERAADVNLKEGRPLIIVPRETPLNTIHLKNMLLLSQCGAKILPAMPGFYNNPSSIEDIINFIVGKTMDLMGVKNSVYKRWCE